MITAIITAAGSGSRSGFEFNKVFFKLPSGKTVLESAAAPFDEASEITEIIFTAAANDVEKIELAASKLSTKTKVVVGGETRSQSVRNALKEASGEIVLIHDGARPFVDRETVEACIRDVLTYGSSVIVTDCVNTVGELDGDYIVRSSRADRCEIQTPQGFYKKDLELACDRANGDYSFTDESSLYCKYIGKAHATKGSPKNVKLTHPEDFAKLTACRSGTGYDLHVLTEGRKLVIGGVTVPHDKGLLGHSDADVLIHAIMDAILSAAGLRDIGYYFSDKDPAYEGICSMTLLAKVNDMIADRGYKVNNISAVIMAEKPKLNPFVPEMRNNVAATLGINYDDVGISCTTSERVGFIGREEGIAVAATCSLTAI